MRCKLGPKKINQLKHKTGLSIVFAYVRGGTDHRIDLYLSDGTIMYLLKDGSLERCPIGWDRKR